MSNIINVRFTYNLPDDQYYLTNDLQKTGQWEYSGPDKKYLLVDKTTNKLTGDQIEGVHYADFNERNDSVYAVEVDCATNPLLCSIFEDAHPDPTSLNRPTITEVIPHSDPYVRDDPPSPEHTHEIKDITYDPVSQQFVTPYPWKKPQETWNLDYDGGTARNSLLAWRKIQLKNTDRQMSEDLPPALYQKMIEYRQYLRDFTELFGASWTVTVVNGGSGFSVGDKVSISDPVFKLNQLVSDLILTITAVDGSGAITEFTKENTSALHHKNSATYQNVYYTTNGAGLGASFTLSKVKLVDPWKITPKDSPLG